MPTRLSLRNGLSSAVVVLLEALCPLAIVMILVDSTKHVGWSAYNGRDPAIYASVARFWQDGLMPYRDVYDFKPPLIFVALRIGYALWGYEAESLRRVLLILTAFGSLILYAGLRRSRAVMAAPIAAIGLITLIVPDSWNLRLQNTETLVAAFAAAGLGCAAAHQRDGRWWWAVAAGACVGLAALGKQPGIFYAVPVVVQLWLWGSPSGWKQRLRYAVERTLLAGCGVAGTFAAVATYFAWRGALRSLYEAVLLDGAYYAYIRPEYLLRPSWWIGLAHHPILNRALVESMRETTFWPFVGSLFVLVPLTVLRPSRWVLVTWLCLCAVYVAFTIAGRTEWHYVIMAYPVFALTVGIVCELTLSGTIPRSASLPRQQLAGGIVIALLVYGGSWFGSYVPHRSVNYSAPDQAAVMGERIHAVAQPGDTLFVEAEPFSVYVWAGLHPATRFIYENPPRSEAKAERAEALKSLPAFVVIKTLSDQRMRNDAERAKDAEIDSLAQILLEHYTEYFRNSAGVAYQRLRNAAQPADEGGAVPEG